MSAKRRTASGAVFFPKAYQSVMDFSKYIQMKQQAANTYKSYWQPRDASEVTQRNLRLAQSGNQTRHWGPPAQCCTTGVFPKKRSTSPTSGFSTTYSGEIVSTRVAGEVTCKDPNWGAAGGVQLKTCAEVSTILEIPANPDKSVDCHCADPGVPFRQIYPPKPIRSYIGWRDQLTWNSPNPSTFLRAVQLPSA